MFKDIINNIALIVALSLMYSLISRTGKGSAKINQAAIGFLFAFIAIGGMMNPVAYAPGIIFDGRSIIISTAGFIAGPLAACIAAVLSALYRFHLGGGGAVMGVLVIAASALIGTACYYLRRRHIVFNRPVYLYAFGIIVHLCMLALTMTLPEAVRFTTLQNIALPVILIYPIGTVLICRFLLDQELRIRMETALLDSEKKYRELVENANSIILRWTRGGVITFINEFGLKFFGYSEPELLGQHVVGTIVPESETTGRDLQPLMDKICTQPETFEHNINENMRRTGERVWIAWTNKIVLNEQGQVKEILSIGIDITERKRAEEVLKQRTQQLAALNALSSKVNASLELSLVTQAALEETLTAVSPDQAFLFVREGDALRLQAEAPQDSHSNHTCVPGLPVGRRLCGLAIQSGCALYFRDIPTDARCAGETGRNAMLRSFAALPLHSGDEVIGALGLASIEQRDFEQQAIFLETLADQVTAGLQNARLHETIKQHAAELEQRVAMRTEELKVAMERAQDADHLKSAFLATMSHELRTPLNSIIGFTGILLQLLAGPLNEEQTKQLTMIRDSARHLLALINDVLDISKIEAGQLEIVKQPFDMRLAVEDVLQTVMPQAVKKGLSLSVAIGSTVGAMVSDNRRVKQILINLVSNAIKFTEHGDVHIDCRINEGLLETRISDTGIGIGQQDMDKLFKPFRQIDTGLTRSHEGTGLGLSICKKLVEMLGGSIGVESEPGAGSTFMFTLPIEQVSGSGGLSPELGVRSKEVQGSKVQS